MPVSTPPSPRPASPSACAGTRVPRRPITLVVAAALALVVMPSLAGAQTLEDDLDHIEDAKTLKSLLRVYAAENERLHQRIVDHLDQEKRPNDPRGVL